MLRFLATVSNVAMTIGQTQRTRENLASKASLKSHFNMEFVEVSCICKLMLEDYPQGISLAFLHFLSYVNRQFAVSQMQ